jgi:hypothetical protein
MNPPPGPESASNNFHMSIPLPPERREAYDALFTGNDEVIHAYFASLFRGLTLEEKYSRRILDECGKVRPEWVENFHLAYPLPRDKVHLLQAAEAGALRDVNAVVQGFQRLGILDEKLRLTESGLFKLISALPLTEQVKRLPVAYDEFSIAKVADASTESYVAARYEELGYECFHDEGAALAILMTCSLLNEIPTLRSLCQDSFALASPITSNLAQMFSHTETLPDGTKRLAPKKIERFCEILARTTRARIEAGWLVRVECGERNGYRALQNYPDLDKVIRLFECLGPERFVQLHRLELQNFGQWGGWPDITAFRGRDVVLVEVKQNDKLMFHQARTITRLASLVPHTLAEIRVARLKLT